MTDSKAIKSAHLNKCQEKVNTVIGKQRAVEVKKQEIEDVKVKYGKAKVGHRYRRRKDDERARIAELEEQKRKLEAMKSNVDQKQAMEEREAKYKDELDKAQQALQSAEAELKESADEFVLVMDADESTKKLKTNTSSFYAIASQLSAMIAGIDDAKKDIDKAGNAAFVQANPQLKNDRELKHLFGDIHRSNWMINPNHGQSSSETIQRLETRQRKIEMNLLPKTDDYAEVDSYYIYSDSRRCVIKLRKVKSHPATWDYEYYYEPCPLEEAVRIFKSCKGRSVSALQQTEVDKNAFADVDMTDANSSG